MVCPYLGQFHRTVDPTEEMVRRGRDMGIIRPRSQGQTEGQITRLKLIKRQGYGRAKFDLLRKRVLSAA
jgi:transposase